MGIAHECVCSKAQNHGNNTADSHVRSGAAAERAGNERYHIATQEHAGAFKALD